MCIAPSYANFGVNSGVESSVRDDAKYPGLANQTKNRAKMIRKISITAVTVACIPALVSKKISCEESSSATRCDLDYPTPGRFV